MKVFLLLFGLLVWVEGAHKKVLLSDVSTITLKEGQMTTGRRSSPVPQMKCVGGAAAHKFAPRVAQCTKAGFNGLDYEWRCVSEMPTDYEFGKITVTCEGFDHPDDPYILHGSCGLEYDLEYTADLKRRTPQHEEATNIIGTWTVVVFIVFVAFYMCLSGRRREDSPDRGSRHYPNDGPGYPPGPDDQDYPTKPPSYGNPSAPPSYDDTMRSENVRQRPNYSSSAPPNEGTRQGFGWNARPRTMGFGGNAGAAQDGQGGAGFWTGAGLGALGGYFMGRRQGQQPEPTRTRPSSSTYSSGYSRASTSAPSCSSSDTHQSTGYGGTSRR